MIDKLTVEKIFDAAQIVDVVSDFVTLRKRGVNYVGLCPFHDDNTPSFYVTPSKNICKCFACGEGGNPVSFIMKHEQMSYQDALRYLAKKYHIEIKERELSDEEKQLNSDRESMLVVNSWAQKFFTSQLNDTDEGRTVGLAYFMERGFREDTVKKFQLGYSPNKRDALYLAGKAEGYKEDYLVRTGLVVKRENGTCSDRFFGRVMFPVHTLSGKIVAFGGRVLGKKDKVAKYVNSPESEIYHKSNELYGIFFAKQAIVKADKCYLVEGYTDVISMHQTGIENVVASSGTALTHGQIRLIHRFTNNITVLYDGDAAGIKAAIRGIDMLLEEGMNIKVVLLPDGEDPDSFARSHNSFDFILFMKEHEVDFIRFKIDLLLKDSGDDPIKRSRLISDIMESVAVIPDNITRTVYIKECSSLLDVREQVLIDQVHNIRERRTRMTQEERRREEERRRNEAEMKEVHVGASGGRYGLSEGVEGLPVRHVAAVEAGGKNIPEENPSPLKMYEAILTQYVVRYGERCVFSIEGDSEDGVDNHRDVLVVEYIVSQLGLDDVEIQTPIYKRIVKEAYEHCRDVGFIASKYFSTHTDLEISVLASDMLMNKYELSRMFEEEAVLYVPSSAKEEDAEELKAKAKEEQKMQEIRRWVVNDIFAMKYAAIRQKLHEIDAEIKKNQEDHGKLQELLTEKIKFDKLKYILSKRLGDRIVTGIGV